MGTEMKTYGELWMEGREEMAQRLFGCSWADLGPEDQNDVIRNLYVELSGVDVEDPPF